MFKYRIIHVSEGLFALALSSFSLTCWLVKNPRAPQQATRGQPPASLVPTVPASPPAAAATLWRVAAAAACGSAKKREK
jgi:hypothetical protein